MLSSQEMNDFIRKQRVARENSNMPLKDIRVLDLGAVVAAPLAGTFMADFGAEVIKVENPGQPDAVRAWAVVEGGLQPWWLYVNRNKLPIVLNLRAPEGVEILASLIKQSDVLLENFRARVLDRLGFPRQRLLELNKGLIIGRVSGFGQTGPYVSRPAFGTIAEGFSGFTYLNAIPGQPPISPHYPMADMVAGMHLAFGVMVALRSAKRGEYGGKELDISLYEPLLGLLGGQFLEYSLTGKVPQPFGSEYTYAAPRNNYRTKDGRWVAMSATAQAPFERMMEAIGKPEYKTDPRFKTNEDRIIPENRAELNRVISEWVASMNVDELLEKCVKLEITAGLITTMKDIDEDQHVNARQSLLEIEDPATGRMLRMPNIPIRLVDNPGACRFPGLPYGSANEVVLQDLLGYSAAKVQELKQKKIILP